MKSTKKKVLGFTLMELLTVMAIIAILAGLVLATMGFVMKKANRERATAEIAGMSNALESYKLDNGDYPRTVTVNSNVYSSDTLDARTNLDATSVAYKSASLVLYVALSGDANLDRSIDATEKAAGKIYYTFKPNMLFPRVSGTSGLAVQFIADPFRNAYGYSTIGSLSTSGTAGGYNPTFDLWSTAGSGTSATLLPSWIKNW